jgi:hypothetical protein
MLRELKMDLCRNRVYGQSSVYLPCSRVHAAVELSRIEFSA